MRVSACASVCRCGGEARKSAEGGGGGTSVAAIHRTEGWKGKGSAPSTARRGRRPGSCSPAILSPSHLRPPSSAPPAASGGPWPSSARCLGKGKERERGGEGEGRRRAVGAVGVFLAASASQQLHPSLSRLRRARQCTELVRGGLRSGLCPWNSPPPMVVCALCS